MSFRSANDIIFEESAITADTVSDIVEIETQVGFSLQVEWIANAGSGAATLTVQASNDNKVWVDTATTQAIASDDSNSMLIVTNSFYKFFRVDINHASGTIASLKITMHAKGV